MYRLKKLLSFSSFQRSWTHGNAPAAALTSWQQHRQFATHPSEGFLSGSSSNYMDLLHESWRQNNQSVHKSWDIYFRNVEAGKPPGAAYQLPPGTTSVGAGLPVPSAGADRDVIQDHLKVQALLHGYQTRGHNIANLDPLCINDADLDDSIPPELDYRNYGFVEADLDREFFLSVAQAKGFLDADNPRPWNLRDLISHLEKTYCQSIGIEYMHIANKEECNWIREQIEVPKPIDFSQDQKKLLLARLIRSHMFENFVATKWSSEKRFGLEGCEVLVPAMKHLIDEAGEHGVESIVIGMPHRGRLNILANVIRKPLSSMFADFAGINEPSEEGSGDVKYHYGMSHDRLTLHGKKVHLSLVANPSHLEAVNPVVMGKCRAEQFYMEDTNRDKVLSVLMHGDASFAGQGVVFESLGLSDLPHYTVGGTIHVVVNNQIGFTTDPRFSRSTPYCTDVAKTVGAPIFHVNADDPEAVARCVELAVQYRYRYHKDVVIDLVCYRRHGHNEIDQPAFTQPLMYEHIKKHPPVMDLYSKRLLAEQVVDEAHIQKTKDEYLNICQQEYDLSKDKNVVKSDWLESKWEGFKGSSDLSQVKDTGVSLEVLSEIGHIISTYPDDFNIHKGLKRIMAQRLQTIESGQDIDWGTGEALAFGALLREGSHVRLSGQDVERGTFSHRHHVLHDQKTEAVYVQLNNVAQDQATYSVSNSSLSEYGVLGFELGYSMTNPRSLVLWEAQFGDFMNTAQAIIDQFLCCGEAKWWRQTGLTLLLPHGYEGAGPEHSSARIERFLQSCDDDSDIIPVMNQAERKQIQEANWQVLNVTTPANYFHALRRQLFREFRKPLILFTPKSLLRHHLAKSKMEEMGPGTRFRRFIPEPFNDTLVENDSIRRLILCSGKVYFDLLKYRSDNDIKDVAIGRVEQISPFPFDLVAKHAMDYPNAEIMWAQEEPKNMGAWTYVDRRIESALKLTNRAGQRPVYAGRQPSASTATGIKKVHLREEAQLLADSFA